MTNYITLLAASALTVGGACAAAATPAGSVPHFAQAPGTGSLTFTFMQAGAENRGSVKQFHTEMVYGEDLAACALEVTVQMTSLDTQDKDRDDTLAGPDLLDTKKHPTARYVADSFAKANGRLEAVGKLTLRGVTRDLRIPLTLRAAGNGYELSGEVTIERLDFGIGQGEWQSTEWVGDEVKLQYKVPLSRSK